MNKKLQSQDLTKNRFKISGLFDSNTFVMVCVLAVVIVIFSFLNPNYLTQGNFINILVAATTIGLLAIGQTYLIIAGHIDLSAGTSAALSGVLTAYILREFALNWPTAVLIALIIAAVVGIINSVLVNVFNLQPFIATLAMASVCRGFAFILSDGRSISLQDQGLIALGTGSVFGIPNPVIIMFVLFIVFGFILSRTVFGRSVYMIGGNRIAAKYAGLNPKKISTYLYIISSLIAALAGILSASRMHAALPGAVSGLEFDAITAAILGGVAFTGGKGTMLGCFIGLLIMQSFNNGLTAVQVPAFWQVVAKGALLIGALIFDYFRTERLKRSAR